jgi:hypothetical protein
MHFSQERWSTGSLIDLARRVKASRAVVQDLR